VRGFLFFGKQVLAMSDPIMQLLESGFQAQQSGNVVTAELAFKQVLEKDRDNIHALNLLGMLCVNAQRSDEAVDFLSRALQQAPDNAQTQNNMGLACKDLGRNVQALENFSNSAKLDPDNPDVHNNRGNVLRALDKPLKAVEAYERALKLHPTFAECWSNLAAALNEAGRHDRALKAVERALHLDRNLAQAYNNRGDIYLAQARYEDAVAEYRIAVRLSPKYTAALINMARTLRDMDSPDEARKTLDLVLEMEPGNPEALLVKGVLNEQLGDKERAAEAFIEAIESAPEMTVAHYYLSQIKGRKGSDDEFAAMKALHTSAELTPKALMYLHFGLFRANDQRGLYDEAFYHLAEGNRVKAESTPYDDDDTAQYVQSIVASAAVAQENLGAAAGHQDSRPVFVLGMPRSGTSLTEQILASHSDVAGAGELSFAYDTAHAIRLLVDEKFPDNLEQLSAEQFAELGRKYMEKHAEEHLSARYVVDKTPLNFQYIGMLALALPGAKFIHCHRDPVANCFSIHRMPFDEKQTYAHSLESLGRYYTRYWLLMQDWHQMFPGRILDVRYEDTVADIESQSRRMLDFLDLEFEEQVLDFYKTRRIVKTPSASQVRQPIYKDSVAAWKNYEKHLGPLIDHIKVKVQLHE
jgi:tetratricopeptide (TPR) repeat protein